MSEHFFSPEARLDLLEIWECIIVFDNLDAADRVTEKIRETDRRDLSKIPNWVIRAWT